MPWMKIDDHLPMHPKFAGLSLEATGLWLVTGAWCAGEMTDGFVPESVVMMFATRASKDSSKLQANCLDLARELLDACLWDACEGGYRFHDWGEYQPSAKKVAETRKKRREAGRRGGKARAARANTSKSEPKQTPSKLLGKRQAKEQAKSNPEPVPEPNRDSTVVESGQLALVTGHTAPATAGASQHGTRLPDDWSPARTDTNLAAEAGRDAAWLTDQLDRFRDYWTGVPGQRGRKANWDATWRNWIRKAAEMSPQRARGGSTPGLSDDEWQDAYRRAVARDASADDTNSSNAPQALPLLPKGA
ncbi:MAG: hypothetical protein E7D82_25880 [Klebsiella michiganensis]|nr:hypothetical protein [Klebsiella michiganensis]DAP87121.1 MAG TPA: replisome organizer [Caudoviricetes sp.]